MHFIVNTRNGSDHSQIQPIIEQTFSPQRKLMNSFCSTFNDESLLIPSLKPGFVPDQSVPVPVLHGDGAGGHHHRVVRHQHATAGKNIWTVPKNISSVQQIFHAVTAAGDDHAAIPRVRRGQGNLPAAARVPLPAASPHLPLRHVRV